MGCFCLCTLKLATMFLYSTNVALAHNGMIDATVDKKLKNTIENYDKN